jgi:GGDEF domain-containing protein
MLDALTREVAVALLDDCSLPVLLLDDSGAIRAWNRAFAGLTGVATEAGHAAFEDLRKDGLLGPLVGQATLVNWIMPDGDERWLAVESVVLLAADGGMARFYHDVTEKLRLRQERDACFTELRRHALKDEMLSSLMNRRGVLHLLDPLVARCRRYDSPLSVIAMGIEAHEERRTLLVTVGHLLRDQTRWADLLGCNDDHDFLLVLQETTRDSALGLVDKLSPHLARLSVGVTSPVNACYGITHCQRDDDPESLIERAERALDEARRQRSGTVICL